MVVEGVDIRTAQHRLGHTDPRLLLNIYAHVSSDADRDAAHRLGEKFLPSEPDVASRVTGLCGLLSSPGPDGPEVGPRLRH